MKKKLLFLTLILTLFVFSTKAQPGSIDTTFSNIRTVGGNSYGLIELSNGKYLLFGQLTNYKNKPAYNIICFNTDGTADLSYPAATNGIVYSIAIQSTTNKIIIAGSFTTVNGVAKTGIARLNLDGTLDQTFNAGAGPIFASNSRGIKRISVQTDGKVLICGDFTQYDGVARVGIARLNQDGSLDAAFVPPTISTYQIETITAHLSSKVIIAGSFTSVGGVTVNYIARLNADGTLDNTFNSGGVGPNQKVSCLAILSTGQIYAGGQFNSYNSITCPNIIRLTTSGTLDNSFSAADGYNLVDLKVDYLGRVLFVTGANSFVGRLNTNGTKDTSFPYFIGSSAGILNWVTVASTNHVLLGGLMGEGFNYDASYKTMDYTTASANPVRLSSNGRLDAGFMSHAIENGAFYGVAEMHPLPDGKIIVSGNEMDSFGSNIKFRNIGLARIFEDGQPDFSFNPQVSSVYYSGVQSTGKVLALDGNVLRRLKIDGVRDATFTNGTITGGVAFIKVLPNDKIILGGSITQYNGVPVSSILRLNEDGTIDNTFNVGTGANGNILNIAIATNGSIFLCGAFTSFNGTTTNRLIKLTSNGAIDNSFSTSGGTGADNQISCIAIQPDGKLLISGSFNSYNGQSGSWTLVRLNANGTYDNTFSKGNTNNYSTIYKIGILPDGKILLVGTFGYATNYQGIARLNTDGSYDNSFVGHGGYRIMDFFQQTPEKVVLCGALVSYGTYGTNAICRINVNPANYNTIRGKVFHDLNNDCVMQANEKPMEGVLIKATPGNFYTSTDSLGNYALKVDGGTITYSVQQIFNPLQQQTLYQNCPVGVYTISLAGINKDTSGFNFSNDVKTCYQLNVSINTRHRRCFRNNTVINYSNEGLQDVPQVQIRVVYPDHVIPLSSTPAWTSKQGNILIYDLNIVKSFATGNIIIIDSVECGNTSLLGVEQCTQVSITRTSNCNTQNPLWDLSDIAVSGSCNGTSADFVIKNKGVGDMSDSSTYRLYRNDTLVYTKKVKLRASETVIVSVNSSSDKFRLEANQLPNFPRWSHPRYTILPCGSFSNATSSTVNQDDEDFETAIDCKPIVGSYDPNEKVATPTGYTLSHYLSPTAKLDYTIHFQNTGTDTAFNVVVKDSLDAALDVSTFVPGVSSHPYRIEIKGKQNPVIYFHFDNVNLPTSNTSSTKSEGFIQFSIYPKSDVLDGTTILNKAAIYFDYNPAIITNIVDHTIKSVDLSDFTTGIQVEQHCAPPALALAVSSTTLCLGDTLFIKANTAGDANPYSFDWTVSAIDNDSIAVVLTNPTLVSLDMADKFGCHTTDDIYVQVNPTPVADAGTDAEIFNGDNTLLGNTATPTITYSWLPISGLDDPTSSQPLFTSSTVGNFDYYLTATNQYGCTSKDTVHVKVDVLTTINNGQVNLPDASPNPFVESVEISNKGNLSGEGHLYNSKGELVHSFTLTNSYKINRGTLPVGIYLLIVEWKDGTKTTQKIIAQ